MSSLSRSVKVMCTTVSSRTIVSYSYSASLSRITLSVPKRQNKSLQTFNFKSAAVTTALSQQHTQTLSSDAASKSPLTKEHFDKLVKNNNIVVFMKGVPDEPRCGFSNAVVQILRMHGVTNYDSHDVLQDESLRQGIKEFTNWPTIPQVFINGEFVGGCDILIEMHKNGELVEQLSKVGIKSALLEQEGNGTNQGSSSNSKQ